jgi:hypothetical protein
MRGECKQSVSIRCMWGVAEAFVCVMHSWIKYRVCWYDVQVRDVQSVWVLPVWGICSVCTTGVHVEYIDVDARVACVQSVFLRCVC